MAFFIVHERGTRFPVLDLSLFKIRLFTAGNIANLVSGLAFAALAFIMTLYFQLVRGYDLLSAGLALIPLDVTLILIGPISGSISDKRGARGLSTLGLVIASVGFLLLSTFTQSTPYSIIALSFCLVGIGIGMFRSPNASSVMGSVSPEKRGISSGVRGTIINTSIVASIPFATALMTADVPYQKLAGIIRDVSPNGKIQVPPADVGIFLAGLQHALLIFSLVVLGSAVFSLMRGPASDSSRREAAQAEESVRGAERVRHVLEILKGGTRKGHSIPGAPAGD
jgi:MFS family permease